MIETICSYCGKKLKTIAEEDSSLKISHGICESCFIPLMEDLGTPMREFLNKIEKPVVIVDDDASIQMANENAKKLLGDDIELLDDRRFGNVIECRHSKEGKGCGRTVHCKSCTIRNTVNQAARGIPQRHIPAFADVANFTKNTRLNFRISAENAGGKILIIIEEVETDESA